MVDLFKCDLFIRYCFVVGCGFVLVGCRLSLVVCFVFCVGFVLVGLIGVVFVVV